MNLVWLVHFIKWRRFRFVVYATVHKALIEQSLSTGEYKDSTFLKIEPDSLEKISFIIVISIDDIMDDGV